VKAVNETGNAGSITLSIKVARIKGSRNQIEVKGDVKSNKPSVAKAPSFYFSDEDGGLHRNDPNQIKFNFEKPNS
jgi:hypothetical protein